MFLSFSFYTQVKGEAHTVETYLSFHNISLIFTQVSLFCLDSSVFMNVLSFVWMQGNLCGNWGMTEAKREIKSISSISQSTKLKLEIYVFRSIVLFMQGMNYTRINYNAQTMTPTLKFRIKKRQ